MHPWQDWEGKRVDTKLTSLWEWKVLKKGEALTEDWGTGSALGTFTIAKLAPYWPAMFPPHPIAQLWPFCGWIALALYNDTPDHVRTTLPLRITYTFPPHKVWHSRYARAAKDGSPPCFTPGPCWATSLLSLRATLGRSLKPEGWTVWTDLSQHCSWLRPSRALLLTQVSLGSSAVPVISRTVFL